MEESESEAFENPEGNLRDFDQNANISDPYSNSVDTRGGYYNRMGSNFTFPNLVSKPNYAYRHNFPNLVGEVSEGDVSHIRDFLNDDASGNNSNQNTEAIYFSNPSTLSNILTKTTTSPQPTTILYTDIFSGKNSLLPEW